MLIQSPAALQWDSKLPSLFLAGSIDGGRAVNWQQELSSSLSHHSCVLLNPRRADWAEGWAAEWEDPQFKEQVNWELEALERADWIFYYFAPNSKAPITLLELGLHAKSGKCLVCCPSPFWRRGNVQAVCARYGISFFSDLETAVAELEKRLQS